jgi:hypothetical protein
MPSSPLHLLLFITAPAFLIGFVQMKTKGISPLPP